MRQFLHRLIALFSVCAIAIPAYAQWKPILVTPPAPYAMPGANSIMASGPRRGHPPLHLAAERPAYVPGQYTVKYRGAAGLDLRRIPVAVEGVRVMGTIPQLRVQRVAIDNPAALDAIKADPRVEWVQQVVARYPLDLTPNDPAYNDLDTNIASDPTTATWFKWDSHMMECGYGWGLWPTRFYNASGKGADAVTVCVIDTGIDYTHPDFVLAGGINTSVDTGGILLTPQDVSIFGGVTTAGAADDYGHGTHVAGIVAASTNNGVGTVGTGYNANIMSVKVVDATGNGTDSDIAMAIVYAADHGAFIISMSLGSYVYSQVEQDAVNYAWSRGSLCIAAAGNDGSDKLNYPGAMSRVLTVSACSRLTLATYSNYGDQVGITAPGGDFDFDINWLLGVYSTMPTYYVTLNDPATYGAAMNYEYLEGTSMATPHVAGAAALLAGSKGWSQDTPGANLAVWQTLQRTANGTGGWSQQFGYGLVFMPTLLNADADPNPRAETRGCITGQVKYKGTVVQSATVRVNPVGTATFTTAATRVDGGYRVTGLLPGLYNVRATYFGDNTTIYNVRVTEGCDSPGADINILGQDTTLAVGDASGGPGSVVELTATLRRASDGVGMPDEPIHFSVGVWGADLLTDASGVARASFTVPAGFSGTIPIRGWFAGDGLLNGSSATGTLNTVVLPATLTTTSPSAAIGGTVTLSATLKDAASAAAIAGHTVNFTVAGIDAGSGVTNASGVATVSFPVAEAVGVGAKVIHAVAPASAGYDSAAADGTLTVSKGASKLFLNAPTAVAAGAYTKLYCYLQRTVDSKNLVGRTVSFTMDGTGPATAVVDVNGYATVDYKVPAGASVGTHAIRVDFAGDALYNPSYKAGSQTVNAGTPVSLYHANTAGGIGATVTLYAYLWKSSDHTMLAGKSIAFKVDGVQVGKVNTDANGYALYKYKVPSGTTAGDHPTRAEFAGDTVYGAGLATAKLTVSSKLATSISMSSKNGSRGLPVTLYCYVWQSVDGAMMPGVTVTFQVDGAAVGTATTNAVGYASVVYTVPVGAAVGTHPLRADYAGSATYDPSYSTTILTVAATADVNLYFPAASGARGSKVTFYCYLTRKLDKAAVASRTVTFKLDGAAIGTAVTNGSGYAAVSYTIPAGASTGSHPAAVEFAGDSLYNAGTASNTLTVR